MNDQKALDKEGLIRYFQRKAQPSDSRVRNIDFGHLIGIPIFLICLGNSRLVHTMYGDRELVEIELLENAGDLQAGEHFAWWLTQRVVQTKIQRFKPLNGKKVCVVALGKKKGHRFAYFDYYIGSAEEGRAILDEMRR
jgi:hypothetical protein